jgi:glyoxylase-like metal-dependent hydrolase (beta-lactamase superfamily II)
MGAMADRLYFRQLLSGRDLAAGDQLARQMVNFVYLVGDRDTGEAVVVDPAYDVDTICDTLAADGMTLTGVLASHYHADHVGGSMMGFSIRGVSDLLEKVSVPIHVQAAEADYVCKTTGLASGDLVTHASGDTVTVGGIDIELIHTPGHTPGSQCFMVENRLVSGDTLFLEGCGRTDLPGSDPREMYESLTQRLAKVPDDALLFPGHWYAPEPSGSMGETRRSNYVFAPRSETQWLQMFGGI